MIAGVHGPLLFVVGFIRIARTCARLKVRTRVNVYEFGLRSVSNIGRA